MTIDLAAVVRGTGATVLWRRADGTLMQDALHAADLMQGFSGVSIDSRHCPPDSLFVALPGTQTDGHRYVEGVLQHGARGCLVEAAKSAELAAQLSPGDRRYLFAVPNPLRALQQLAAHWRDLHEAEVVGITGSIGKTTTKEIVAGLLALRWPVLRSAANLNTEIGLPLMLLGLRVEHRVAVLEMGMYLPGDIAALAEIARPTIGAVTTVEPIHLERVGSIERIARTKAELVAALPSSGLAVLNADNRWTRAMAQTGGQAPSVLVGLAPDASYRATDVVSHGLDGVSFHLHAPEHSMTVRTRLPGIHLIHAYLMAAAIARRVGMSWGEIADGLATVTLEGRQQVIHQRDDLLIIDDAYNAAPLSVAAALSLLSEAPGNKIAVLGDMLELGPDEQRLHEEIGERTAETADWLIARGERARWIAAGAERAGFPSTRIRLASSNEEAETFVRSLVGAATPIAAGSTGPTMQRLDEQDSASGWTVLVKGSRGMAMEEIVQGLQGSR